MCPEVSTHTQTGSMKTVLAVLAFCACAAYAQDVQCDTMNGLLVKQEWVSVFGSGLSREQFGHAIWRRMYQLAPGTVDYFARVNGKNIYSSMFIAHSYRLLGGLDMCIALLDDPDTLNAQLAFLRMQHIERGIENVYFDKLGQTLLEVMPTFMGKGYHNVKAWQACLKRITSGIQQ